MNTIRGLGEEVKEAIVDQKVLRNLPNRFNPKIYALEERTDLKNMTVDQLHGTLVAYEMIIEDEDTSRKEVNSRYPPNKLGRTNQRRTSQQVMKK